MVSQVAGPAAWGFRGKILQFVGLLSTLVGFLATLFLIRVSDDPSLLMTLALAAELFLILFIVGVVVETSAINRLAGVYQLGGVRGVALSATTILIAGIVAVMITPFVSPLLYYLASLIMFFALLIWALLMRAVYKRFAVHTGIGAFSDAAIWHLVGGILPILLFVGFVFAMRAYRQLTKEDIPTPPRTPKALVIAIIAIAVGYLAFLELGYILGTTGLILSPTATPSGVGFDAVLSVSDAFVFFNGSEARGRPVSYGDAYVYVVAYAPGVALPSAVVQRITFDAAEKPVYVLPIPLRGEIMPNDFRGVLPDNAKNPVILLTYPSDKLTTVESWLRSIKNLPQSNYIRVELRNGQPVSAVAVA